MPNQSTLPARIIALCVLTSFGVITLGHVIANRSLVFLDYLNGYAQDYVDFFKASNLLLEGQSPYAVPNNRYVTTPIPALLNTILVPLGFDRARTVLYFLIPLAMGIGYQLVTKSSQFPEQEERSVQLAGAACLLFGYPFYFLIHRENIDGWVFLFLCAGLYWMMQPRKEFWSGLAFSLAIAFKIYPALILLPILLQRRWRLFLWTGFWLGLWAGISLFWFQDLQNAVAFRSQSFFRFDENGSLVATVGLIGVLLSAMGISIQTATGIIRFSPLIAAILFGILLSVVIFSDTIRNKKTRQESLEAALYLPFMVALPQVVYHYSFVICIILIPVLCRLWATHESRAQRAAIFATALGIAMTQWQAIATSLLTDNVLAHGIPGLGLLIALLGITLFKVQAVRFGVPELQSGK